MTGSRAWWSLGALSGVLYAFSGLAACATAEVPLDVVRRTDASGPGFDVLDLRDGAMGECDPGATRGCYTGPAATQRIGVCVDGIQTCNSAGLWNTTCLAQTLPRAMEVCGNALDDDCNGMTDDGCECMTGASRVCYTGPVSTQRVGACHDGMQSCGAGGRWSPDCAGEARPAAGEVCGNSVDDDCNGMTDEGCGGCTPGDSRPCFLGSASARNVGTCRDGVQLCTAARTWSADCMGQVLPAAAEVCGNFMDDDCNGRADEGCPPESDPCNANHMCSVCTAARNCGWCSNVSRCIFGDFFGPRDGACGFLNWRWLSISSCGGTSDPCTTNATCSSCAAAAGCGWCRNLSSCHGGSSTGPTNGACPASSWNYTASSCPATDPCMANTTCTACGGASGCGWCRSRSTCYSGTASGPTGGACAAADWAYTASACTPPDPCASNSSCTACVAASGCGFCPNVRRCISGTFFGPRDSACSFSDWIWTASSRCTSSDPCATNTNCGTCSAAAGCGWCIDRGACASGSSTGPTDASCTSTNWAWTSDRCP